jgi:hypothetical protein
MPHIKYYNIAQFEMDEYNKAKEKGGGGMERQEFDDEAERRAEMKRLKLQQEAQQFSQLKAQLVQQQQLREDMRRQETLRAELQLAFKSGDQASVRRLEKLLAPDDPSAAAGPKHPWAR